MQCMHERTLNMKKSASTFRESYIHGTLKPLILIYFEKNGTFGTQWQSLINSLFGGKIGVVQKMNMCAFKKNFKTNPPERSFKIGFKNFLQEDLFEFC